MKAGMIFSLRYHKSGKLSAQINHIGGYSSFSWDWPPVVGVLKRALIINNNHHSP